jgi:hypothetical protein
MAAQRMIDVYKLESWINRGKDLSQMKGRKVKHHSFGVGTLDFIGPKRARRVAVRMVMPCSYGECKKCHTVYLGIGLHSGAWCYCYDKRTGKYLANLRDQVVCCSHHHKERK